MTSNSNRTLNQDIHVIIATITELFVHDGAAHEVKITANAQPDLQMLYSEFGTDTYRLILKISTSVYSQVYTNIENYERNILEKALTIARSYSNEVLHDVIISPLSTEKDWQEKANNWIAGKNVTNQGRVRSNNIAFKECDGLLFRSHNEILFYKALKSLGIPFAPLPVFIQGGNQYKRIEPDFLVVKDGVMLIVEIDGDTVHHETPAEAHSRIKMLVDEGVHIERIKASDIQTPEQAYWYAKNIVQIINKIRSR